MRPGAFLAGGLALVALGGAVALASPGPAVPTAARSEPSPTPSPTPNPALSATPSPTPSPTPTVAVATPAPTIHPAVNQVTIAMPVYVQTMNLDCETAALQMALEAMGHKYTQAQLFALENPDTKPPVMGPNKHVLQWGDPYANYVGNVNGADLIPTGYGIYYPVILSIAQSHGVPHAYGGEELTAKAIYAALAAEHPVEAWTETGWERPYVGTWTAWDGRQIRYSLVEHAVTLSGVSPTSVRVNDPWHGTQYWISKSQFEISWRDFNNMAIVFQ